MGADTEGGDHDGPPRADSGSDHPAADPAHPEAARAATNPATETPPNKKKRHISTWIALASAVAAIIAATISGLQVNVARQQNVAAEQQQLLTLTVDIAQQFAQWQKTLNQAGGTLTGPAEMTALSTASVAIYAQVTADGEAAAALIANLGRNRVAGIEYIEVANALANGEDAAQAIVYYQDAATAPPHTPAMVASALRSEAGLYYSLGRYVTGHDYSMRAVNVYSGHLEVTKYNIDNETAQSYLNDAYYQLKINGCKIAQDDIAAAEKALSPLGAGGLNAVNAQGLSLDRTAYSKHCPSTTASPATTH